jgi:hypothetical protein
MEYGVPEECLEGHGVGFNLFYVFNTFYLTRPSKLLILFYNRYRIRKKLRVFYESNRKHRHSKSDRHCH